MERLKKQRSSEPPAVREAGKRRFRSAVWLLAVGLGVGAALLVIPLTNTGPAAPDFQRLVGRWVRTDGGYILEVRNATADGKVEASYFNPNPINVAQARAEGDGDTVRLFIELRDVGYPGSTYTLRHDGERNELQGVYFQAATRESFAVTFTREK